MVARAFLRPVVVLSNVVGRARHLRDEQAKVVRGC
jgi:hypothetical protein